jgi:hypothetical protein
MQDCSLHKIAHTISKLTKTIFGTKCLLWPATSLGATPDLLTALSDAICPLAKYVHGNMTNRFGFDLPPDRLRWAAAEGVSEDVIAAVLLLHERSVEEIVPQLSPAELEKVIELVGRSPRLYPRGILEALDQHKSSPASAPIAQSVPPNASSKEEATPSAIAAHPPPRSDAQHSSRTGPDGRQSPTERAKCCDAVALGEGGQRLAHSTSNFSIRVPIL